MAAKLDEIKMEVVPDDSPDASYLEQRGLGFEERLEAYNRGDFGFVGVRAVAVIEIPFGEGIIIETISSPGLWGIESDSGDEYLNDVYTEETYVLKDMLRELGVEGVQ